MNDLIRHPSLIRSAQDIGRGNHLIGSPNVNEIEKIIRDSEISQIELYHGNKKQPKVEVIKEIYPFITFSNFSLLNL